MSKINTKTKTVEKIKYELILSWSSNLIYRDIQQENYNLKNGQKFLNLIV